jgi:charged multivesicular body protein 6
MNYIGSLRLCLFIIFQVLNSLKAGNESLKEVHKLFSIEDIEQIMDETREGIEKQKVPIVPILMLIVLTTKIS